MNIRYVFAWLIVLIIVVSDTGMCAETGEWGAWSVDNSVKKVIKQDKDSLYDGNILKMALTAGVRFFQKFVSPVDGDRCSMYPTCSHYSAQALKKHGAVMGFIMTADRLLHEVGEQKLAPIVLKHGQYRYFDPIENNDFWWYKKKR